MSNDKSQKSYGQRSLLTVDYCQNNLIMRKSLLLAFAILLSTVVFAQNRTSFISESFEGSQLPEEWYIDGEGESSWLISATNKAGGDANELKLNYNPSFVGLSRVVMNSVDLSGVESVTINFKHFIDHFDGEHTIGIATSSDGETWNTGWSQNYNSTGYYTINESITTPDMGKSNVRFCLFYEGDNYNINSWFFDNFDILTQNSVDIKICSIDIPNIVAAETLNVNFTVQNIGSTAIESFKIKASNNNSDSEEFTFDTNIAPFDRAQFSFVAPFNTNIPGTYYLIIDIINVNGTSDDDESNNEMMKEVNVAMGQTQKIPMIEHFSSSTCQPCINVNQEMEQLTENNPGKYTYTKYTVNWPGMGDPYYTDEVGTRVGYYAVATAPMLFLDGENKGASGITQELIDQQYGSPAYANIRGAFTVEGDIINVTADFMAYADMNNVRAYIAVNEKTTSGNAGSNGEIEFHHVMMKMFENGEGNSIDIKAGKYQRFNFTYDLSTTNVEETDDLEVSLWLQDNESKVIYNSRFAYEYADHCYPVNNHQMTENGGNLQATWDAPIQGDPTGYDVYLNGELVLENTSDMSYTIENDGNIYYVEVVALYGDKSSVGTISTNKEEEETPCNAPTNLNATIEGEDAGCTVTLTWDAVAGVEEYLVDLDGEVTTVYENSHVVEFETEGNHSFKVASVCENGQSDYSEPYDFYVTFTSIEELDNDFMIYPNPASDFIKLSASRHQLSAVKVYNYLGILVEEIEVNANEVEINTSNYNAGIYFINIQTENGNVTKKVVVE